MVVVAFLRRAAVVLVVLAAVPLGVLADTDAAAPPGSPQAPQAADPCGGYGRLLATLNRPTIGYSACAVPKGAIVLEEGYQNQSRGGSDGSVTTSYPQGFERFGVGDRFEVDLVGPNFNRSRTAGAVTSGWSDAGLGFKYELPQRGRFTYAVDGLFTPAVGTGGFGAGGPTETLNADIAYSVSPAIGIGTTLAAVSSAGSFVSAGPSSASTAAARFGYFLPSLVVTVQFPHAYQFYAELVGQTKLGPGQGGHVFTDFGLQKLLSPAIELDAEYGIEFAPAGGAGFTYIGLGAGIRVR